MKKTILFFVITLAVSVSHAQNTEWLKGWGGLTDDNSQAVHVDPSNNVYTTGMFQGTVDFDPGLGFLNLTATGTGDGYVSKLDNSGNLAWAVQFGGAGFVQGRTVALDPSGNVYTAGSFEGTVDFDPGPGISNLVSEGLSDIYICKLTGTGSFLWAKNIGGLTNDVAISIAVDDDGNVYATGIYSQLVDFDPGPGIFNLTSSGATSIFLTQLDAAGNFGWAKSIDGDLNLPGALILDASKNIYTTGYFSAPTDFDLGAGNSFLTPAGKDVYVVKYDSACNLIWARGLGGASDDAGYSLATDAAGNIYSAGSFTGPADFDPGAGIFDLNSGPGFISKLDSAGNFVWAKELGGTVTGIDLDFSGNGAVYATGVFSGTSDFDPDTGVFTITSTPSSIRELFLSKLDTTGDFLLAKHMGIGNPMDAYPTGIDVDASGHAFVTGLFFGTVISFDTMTVTSNGGFETFLAKINCSNETTMTATACKSYTGFSGNTWTESGRYVDTKPNVGSCDSAFVVSVTIIHPDTSVSQNGNQLTSNSTGTYQWVDCNSGLDLPGETGAVFNPSANGSYLVVVNENGCIDTSACFAVTGVGMDEIAGLRNEITIYPNPAENETVIRCSRSVEKIELYNLTGQLVVSMVTGPDSGNQVILNTSKVAPGMYYLTVYSNSEKATFKVARK